MTAKLGKNSHHVKSYPFWSNPFLTPKVNTSFKVHVNSNSVIEYELKLKSFPYKLSYAYNFVRSLSCGKCA